MAAAIGLYLMGLWLWIFTSIRWVGAGIVIGILLLHLGEMKTAFSIGRKKGLSDMRTFLMNLAFGFTWWLPLKKGVFDS